MELKDTRVVYWYTCNCDTLSKYCTENHEARARIPLDVLNAYIIEEEN